MSWDIHVWRFPARFSLHRNWTYFRLTWLRTLLFCPPLSRKQGDIKSHSSVRPSVRPSVTKTLTWLISSEVLKIEHWYLACMVLVTSLFKWGHAVTLTFDLLQGQSCCRAGDHNSPNLLVVPFINMHNKLALSGFSSVSYISVINISQMRYSFRMRIDTYTKYINAPTCQECSKRKYILKWIWRFLLGLK